VKQICQLSIYIISRLGQIPSRLSWVPPVQSTIDTTDMLSYLTLLIALVFG